MPESLNARLYFLGRVSDKGAALFHAYNAWKKACAAADAAERLAEEDAGFYARQKPVYLRRARQRLKESKDTLFKCWLAAWRSDLKAVDQDCLKVVAREAGYKLRILAA